MLFIIIFLKKSKFKLFWGFMRGELQKNYNYYKIIKNVDIFEELEKRGISGKEHK